MYGGKDDRRSDRESGRPRSVTAEIMTPFEILPGGERRVHPRYEILAQVRVKYGRITQVLEVRNISLSGLFVTVTDPKRLSKYRIGQTIEMDLFVADELENVRVTARVARVADERTTGPPGFGAEFVDLPPAAREAVARLVDLAARRSIPPPQPPPLPNLPPPESL